MDYESRQVHYLRVLVRDNKDPYGNADTATDGSRLVTISVTNVEEAGTVELTTEHPEVDEQLTAELSDPDGSISNLTWQWQQADTAEAVSWTDISGATAASYTPTLNDVGKFLRAKASYDDAEGTGREALVSTTSAVTRPAIEPPEFDEGGSATRTVAENAVAGTRVGAVTTATDPRRRFLNLLAGKRD